jgi:hypothetical protein
MKKLIVPLMLSLMALPAMAQPVYRYTPAKPAAEVAEKAPLLDTHVGFGLGARVINTTLGSGKLAGWADSEVLFDGAFRQQDLLFNLELSRYKVGANVGGIPANLNPAYSIETADYHFSLARMMPMGANAEWGPMLAANWSINTPSNSAFPFSGTPYDYTQNRAGIGVGALGAWDLRNGWLLDGSATLYPWVFNRLDRAPYQLGYLGGIELGAGIGYRFTEAMRATLAYRGQYVGGSNLNDQNHRFMVGLTYDFLGR